MILRRSIEIVLICSALTSTPLASLFAQSRSLDAKIGASFFSGGSSSSGLLFGAGIDIPVDKSIFVRPEFNLTTHSGTPSEISGMIKYFVPSEKGMSLYVNGGLGLWFRSGGSSLGANFGGGTIFSAGGEKFSIPVEIKLGPVVETNNTTFQAALTSGIRFNLK